MLRSLKISRKMYALPIMVGIILSLIISAISVSAVTEEQAMNNLTTYVYAKVSQNDYTLKEGGSVKGSDLFDGQPTDGYDLDEKQFQSLSSKAQSELVSDIAEYSKEAVDKNVSGVEESTVQTWWKDLQTKDGVGSKFMNEILKDTKPDFVTANKIYQPFSGLVGTILGLGAILIMSFLGLVIVADIAYITLPPLRIATDDSGGNGKLSTSKIFSADAIKAVQIAEDSSTSGGGEGKHALGIYFKRRVVALILLGVCLLYLVQGQIYTLVGYILDLVSGFLGF